MAMAFTTRRSVVRAREWGRHVHGTVVITFQAIKLVSFCGF
jgi:hypothetical protein